MEYPHPYESLAYAAHLSFRDAHGLEAVFDCYQLLRVVAPEMNEITHRIWGTGDQLHAYYSPSTEPPTAIALNGTHMLVSKLKRPARRGDIIEIHSTRRIHHAFKGQDCKWEYVPFSPTEKARVAIRFPIGREPAGISVGATPGSRTPFVRRPAVKDLVFNVADPSIGSTYRVEWSW